MSSGMSELTMLLNVLRIAVKFCANAKKGTDMNRALSVAIFFIRIDKWLLI